MYEEIEQFFLRRLLKKIKPEFEDVKELYSNRSKVAVILAGEPRSFMVCYKSMFEMFNGVDVDIYIYAWNDFWAIKMSDEEATDTLINIYSPKKIIVKEYDEVDKFCVNRWREYSIRRGLFNNWNNFPQYYTIQRAYKLIEDPDSYDYIIRCRFDLPYQSKIDWGRDSNLFDKFICFNGIGLSNFALELIMNDLFIIGNSKNMKVYANFFDRMMDARLFKIYKKTGLGSCEASLFHYLGINDIKAVPIDGFDCGFPVRLSDYRMKEFLY